MKFRQLKIEKNSVSKTQNSLEVGILLSAVGGILDVHTFLFRNGIFANTQTGNIVILAMALLEKNIDKIFRCVFSLAAFVFGVFLTEILKNFKRFNFFSVILLIEIVFLSFLALIPKNVCNRFVIIIISFVCSIQTASFRSLKGSQYATTMCTGNLRSAAYNLYMFLSKKDSEAGLICVRYFIIIISFFIGALGGQILTQFFGQFCLIFCSLILFIALILDIFKIKLR